MLNLKTLLVAAVAVLFATALAPTPTFAVETNCSQPVSDMTSCSYEPEDCWIENETSHLPWLAPPKDPGWKANPNVSRAFCSPSNASGGTNGHWYSYSIYLPEGYDSAENAGVRYPVVYWLHGTLSDPELFKGRGSATAMRVNKRMMQRHILPVIYVFPYGGVFTDAPDEYSWIDQWTDGGVDDEHPGCDPDQPDVCFKSDTALDELMAHIDANYRTIQRGEARGIEGFSRGGGMALQRAFRRDGGDYLFGSLAANSAAANWESARYSPSAEQLALDYVNLYPEDGDRPIDILLKHGDLELDQSAIPTQDFSNFLLEDVFFKARTLSTADPVSHSYEHVIPACGEEREYPAPCATDPPILGHDQPRMDLLRGDEVIAFHDAKLEENLTEDELNDLYEHRMPCADKLDWITDEPAIGSSNEAYMAGDFDGDGCDSIAIKHGDSIYVNNDLDHQVDETVSFGPPDADFFPIDWRDEGLHEFAYSQYGTAECPNSFEIRFYTEDRDGDGHGPEDEPFFCFDAPEGSQILAGDFDGDWKEDIAYRDVNYLYWTVQTAAGFTGEIAGSTKFGTKTKEDEYGNGKWVFGQEVDGFAVRRHNEMLFNEEHDGAHNSVFKFGTGDKEDQYFFGDWNGDGRTSLGVRRCNQMLLDVTFDGAHDYQYYFGWGTGGCWCDKSC